MAHWQAFGGTSDSNKCKGCGVTPPNSGGYPGYCALCDIAIERGLMSPFGPLTDLPALLEGRELSYNTQVERLSGGMNTSSLRSGNRSHQQAPIQECPIGSPSYHNVAQQFAIQWKHSTQVPGVLKVWKINMDRSVLNRFNSYQRRVASRSGILNGNTCRRFHGTARKCSLGDDSLKGGNTNFKRFGVGIYTSATSSKANDYSTSTASPWKAMLLNDVVMGKAIKLTRTDTSLTKPPQGYDSVIGEPGGDLNYDEAVVYNQDAICPSFLIIYS
ncbi:hypothetical protein BC827DRAFT_590408 [Russula dissimulans]|nr:hypothetical protein BC827DRAFT_590408 [Russula dissimulans]